MIANRSMPRGTVIPELSYDDVREAAEWLCAAFGFTVRLRIANHRVQLNVGDGAVVVTERRRASSSDERALQVERAPAVMVRVADVDRHCGQASAAGARILNQPAMYPYGERQYSVEDPGGHVWTFSESVADVAPEDWGGVVGQL